ncbi:hypothetical protein LTR62_001159 [Meristemomyces frigidus]|uniref:WIBG Mago-binding domain-containing protein n=1 Tax=Meristemomyces frigidus TaxID=1508187 RepID=A0AAN7YQN1_9PEZI|nr:hypothetical protein LTR62_001159 [Meristemomyces frigidus]
MPPSTKTPANSGIQKTSTGDSVIPSSTRPDGSVRKAIRVKPGYKPPEDVEVYKNRTAEGFRTRGKGPVPGAESVVDEKLAPHSVAAAKNAKRREARRKAANEGGGDGDTEGKTVAGSAVTEPAATTEPPPPLDPEAEAAKEARKLAKKLRQARELMEKKEQGGDLLPEQFAKVIKIQELIRQLDGLGFDGEGERKPAD